MITIPITVNNDYKTNLCLIYELSETRLKLDISGPYYFGRFNRLGFYMYNGIGKIISDDLGFLKIIGVDEYEL